MPSAARKTAKHPKRQRCGTVFSTGIHSRQYLRGMAALLFEINFYATSISCSYTAWAEKNEPQPNLREDTLSTGHALRGE